MPASSCHLRQKFPFLLVTFGNSSYTLDPSPITNMYIANIFSQAEACFFICLIVFEKQNPKNTYEYSLLIFFLIDCAFGIISIDAGKAFGNIQNPSTIKKKKKTLIILSIEKNFLNLRRTSTKHLQLILHLMVK